MRLVMIAMLAACSTHGDYPIQPGGGGGGAGGRVDAAIDDGRDGGVQLVGRVCLASDPRILTLCAGAGASGLTVTLGGQTATTADDGTFVMARPVGTNLEWQITGTAIVTSAMSFGAVATIPALTSTTFADMLASNGLILTAGEGSIIASVTRAGAPLTAATATASPPPQYPTFYDGSSASTWNQSSTGAHGTLWIPGASTGTATLSITPQTGTATMIAGIAVIDGAITFVTADVP